MFNIVLQNRKKIILFFVLSLIIFSSVAQTKLSFCLSNTEDGIPEWPFTTITYAENKMVRCMVNVETGGIKLYNVVYRILKKDDKGIFNLTNEFDLEVKPDWNWFYYQVIFNGAGDYKVEVVSDNKQMVASGVLHLVSE